MRRLLLTLILAIAVLGTLVGVAHGQTKPEFKLGFKALADQIPDVVGQPLENEHWGANGDSLQQTTSGLMAWRRFDNWTAFTNGSTTWINGPYGVQSRANNERFPWEQEPPPQPTPLPTATPVPPPQSSPTPISLTAYANIYTIDASFAVRNPPGGPADGAVLRVGTYTAVAKTSYAQISGIPPGQYEVSVTLPGYHPHVETVSLEPSNPAFWDCGLKERLFGTTFGLGEIPLFRGDWTLVANSDHSLTFALPPTASARDVQDVKNIAPQVSQAYQFYRTFYGKLPSYWGRQYIALDPGYPGGGGFAGNPVYVGSYPRDWGSTDGLYVAVHELGHNFANSNLVGCLGLSKVLRNGMSGGWENMVHVVVQLGDGYALKKLGHPEKAQQREAAFLNQLALYEQAGSPFAALNLCDGQNITIGGQTLDPFNVLSGMFITLKSRAGDDYFARFLNQRSFYQVNTGPACNAALLSTLGEYMVRAAQPVGVEDLMNKWHFPHSAPNP